MARDGEQATDQLADVPGTPPSVARDCGGKLAFLALRITLGLILFAAALLKVAWDARTPLPARVGILQARPVVLAASFFEVLLAAALVAGLWPRLVRRVTIGTLLIFACIAGIEAMHHAPSCGCFGSVKVAPAHTALFDVGTAVLFLLVRPTVVGAPPGTQPLLRKIAAIAIILLGSGLAGALEFRLRPPTDAALPLAAAGRSVEEPGTPGSLLVLEPDSWAGKPLSLLPHIDVGAELGHGRWIVLLVHHDCDHCAAAVPLYAGRLNAAGRTAAGARLAVIEMPPFAAAGELPAPWMSLPASVLAGRLDQQRDWFAATPVAALLQDGQVIAARDGAAAERPDPGW